MHGIDLAVQVLSDDLFLLLRSGLSERGQQLLGGVAVRGDLLLGGGDLGLGRGHRRVASTGCELHSTLRGRE